MFKFAVLAFAQVATSQTLINCLTGTDDASPYVAPKAVAGTATCAYCSIGMKKTTMAWECDTMWEFPTKVADDQWTTGAVCLTAEAILKNYASKEQVAEHMKMIEKEIADQKAAGVTLTIDQVMADHAKMKMYYCSKANCNTFINLDDACKTVKTVAYDSAKDTGYWKDSAAIFISASAALTAAFSLI